MFSALFQQRPMPDEGDYFKADWFRTYGSPPTHDRMRIYIGTDFAMTSATATGPSSRRRLRP